MGNKLLKRENILHDIMSMLHLCIGLRPSWRALRQIYHWMFGLRPIPQLHFLQYYLPVLSGQLRANGANYHHRQLSDDQLVRLRSVQSWTEGQ